MNSDGPAIPLEALLAHRSWVERLAQRLVSDDGLAEDSAQQTWLKALRIDATSIRRPRAWLGKVLRNTAAEEGRSAGVRREREERVAAPEALPAADEVVARAEIHRRVAEAVMGLDEPYRTTLLLRYFEGLPPRAVASRMTCPVETVRSRTQRGLERLRRVFADERGPKGWQAWLLPLVRWPGRAEGGAAAASLTAKGVGMDVMMRWMLFSLLTVGAVTGWALWGGEAEPEPVSPGLLRGEIGLAERSPTAEDPLPTPIATTPLRDAAPSIEATSAADAPQSPGERRATTPVAAAAQGELGLRIDVQPPAPRPGEKITLTAIFENRGQEPVEFFVPRFAGSHPFPTWRLEGPGGVVLAPATQPFQSMWRGGIQGRVVKLAPGQTWKLENAPTGFVPVDEATGKTRSWAPDLPLRPGRYFVRARYDHAEAAVPFSDRAFEVRPQPHPGLWTGTLWSPSQWLELSRGHAPMMTIEATAADEGTPHRLRLRIDNPGTEPLSLEGRLHFAASCKATAAGTMEMPMPAGSRSLAPGATTELLIHLDHHAWVTRPYGYRHDRKPYRGGLLDTFGAGTLAVTASFRATGAPDATPLRSNLLFVGLDEGPDLGERGLALMASVRSTDAAGLPRLNITLRNDGPSPCRIPGTLSRPRHLDVNLIRPDGLDAHPPKEDTASRAMDEVLRELIPHSRVARAVTAVSLDRKKEPPLALTRRDFIDLAPGTFIARELDLGAILREPLAPGDYELRLRWRNGESGHRLGLGDTPATTGQVRAETLKFRIP